MFGSRLCKLQPEREGRPIVLCIVGKGPPPAVRNVDILWKGHICKAVIADAEYGAAVGVGNGEAEDKGPGNRERGGK